MRTTKIRREVKAKNKKRLRNTRIRVTLEAKDAAIFVFVERVAENEDRVLEIS